MGMVNQMVIRQMIAEADEQGADSLILDICRELLDEIENLQEEVTGVME